MRGQEQRWDRSSPGPLQVTALPAASPRLESDAVTSRVSALISDQPALREAPIALPEDGSRGHGCWTFPGPCCRRSARPHCLSLTGIQPGQAASLCTRPGPSRQHRPRARASCSLLLLVDTGLWPGPRRHRNRTHRTGLSTGLSQPSQRFPTQGPLSEPLPHCGCPSVGSWDGRRPPCPPHPLLSSFSAVPSSHLSSLPLTAVSALLPASVGLTTALARGKLPEALMTPPGVEAGSPTPDHPAHLSAQPQTPRQTQQACGWQASASGSPTPGVSPHSCRACQYP